MSIPTALFVNFDTEAQEQIERTEAIDYVFAPTISSFIREFETWAGIAIIVILDDTNLYKSVRKYFSQSNVSIKVLLEHKDTIASLGSRLANERRLLSFSSHVACHRKSLEWFGFLPIAVSSEPRPGEDVLRFKKSESLINIGGADERFRCPVYYVKWDELNVLRDSLRKERMLEERFSRTMSRGFFSVACDRLILKSHSFSYPNSIVDELRFYLGIIDGDFASSSGGQKVCETLVKAESNFEHSLLFAIFLIEICLKLKVENKCIIYKYVLAALFHDLGFNDQHDMDEVVFIDHMRGILDHDKTYTFISHGERSIEALSKVQDVPEDCLLLINSHHEWVDGSGFPRGYGSDRINDFQLLFNSCHQYIELYQLSGGVSSDFFKHNLRFEDIPGLKSYRSRFLRLLEKIER
jgi:HD-GYP domain-containing protein (c-di-GMP phosphodiesterase class II)